MRITEHLRAELPALLRRLNVCCLVDAPCGDCNWISQTDLGGIDYHGIDLSGDHLAVAAGKNWNGPQRPRNHKLERGDILRVSLPIADAFLCREFFQHIPNKAVLKFLDKVRRNGCIWLLATSAESDNREIGPDMFRPLDLTAAPFNLGSPAFEIADPPGSGRILGAWRL